MPYQSTKRQIWLIGGTQESAQIAAVLAQKGLHCIVSATTVTAKALYPQAPNLQVYLGQLTATQIEEFIQQQQIVAILDASHPYAVEISTSTIAAAQKWQIPYLRYERPMVAAKNSTQIIEVDSFDSLIAGNYLNYQRVLLTVGYKPLHLFRPKQAQATLFARILPSKTALAAAESAGFTPERLICLRPPISAALETALWQQWQISLVVTKASGTPGGEDIKRTVAANLGVPLVVINRPSMYYPQQTEDFEVALEFCLQKGNRGEG